MSVFGNFFKFQLEIGTYADQDDELKKKILFCNLMAVFCGWACIPWALMTYAMGLKISAIALIIASGFNFIALALNAFTRDGCGRYLVPLILSVLVTFNSIAWGKDGGAQVFLFVVGCAPVLFFNVKEILGLLYSALLPVIGFYIDHFYLESHPPFYPDLSKELLSILYVSSSGTTFILLMLTVYYFYRLAAERELGLKDALIQNLKQQEVLIHKSKTASLGEMASGIAHEINNPLSIIQGTSNLLEKKLHKNNIIKPDLIAGFDTMNTAILRVAKIIDGLRKFAKDHSQDPFEVVPLKDIVSDTLDLCRGRIIDQDIDFKVAEIDPNLKVRCRPVELSHVLINLLNNAQDSVAGHRGAWISLDVEKKDDFVSILIEDNGEGVSPEISNKIFLPFFTTKVTGSGIGLGLSIAKGIVEQHKGELSLENRCRFKVTLPEVSNTIQ